MLSYFYLNINGRCSRKIYWLVGVLPFFLLGILGFFISNALQLNDTFFFVINLLVLWPILAMQIKRLHDINLTGWLCLITVVPLVGFVFSIVIGLIPGKNEDNKYAKSIYQS